MEDRFIYNVLQRQSKWNANRRAPYHSDRPYIPVYADVGEERRNTDVMVGTVGLGYGLTTRSEVYVRTSAFWSNTRTETNNSTSSSSSDGLSDVWIGTSYHFKNDDDSSPGLVGFSEIALLEKSHSVTSQFKSGMIGLTAYKAIDPVVFSANTAYRMGATRGQGDSRRRPGSVLLIGGSVAFAANERVSLSSGVQWRNQQPDEINGQKKGFRNTRTSLSLGVGYGIDATNIVNVSLRTDISGRDGADLNLAWAYTF